jgi:tetratricopeptide (TPR) repeat protein
VSTRKPSLLKTIIPATLALGFMGGAGASTRFTPTDAGFVVVEKSTHGSGAAASAAPDAIGAAQTARELIERARTEREPRYFGYAEAVIQPWLKSAGAANPELLLLKADIQQNRHEFANAIATLDRAIQGQSRDPRAYLQRASIQMVRGEFSAARADCRELITGGEIAIGSVCMAQAVGASGNAERAEAMIRALLSNGHEFDSSTHAWALATLADLTRRRGADGEAETLLKQAVDLAPTDDSIRCALADLLLDRAANPEVVALTTVERPSLALLLRRTIAQHRMKDSHVVETSRRFLELIDIDRQRSERAHLREEALFALEVTGDAQGAAKLAAANFKVQRESADIRLLARSAVAAKNSAALSELRQWLTATGYRDRKLDSLLPEKQG